MADEPGAFALPPISEQEPCGPDLDMAGDAEFLNYMAATEGLLPASFFAFDRKTIDFPASIAAGDRILTRAHDLRLLILLAKLAILNRDLAGFARRIGAIGWLVANQWENVHPRADDGNFSMRLWQLGSLNDGPVVVLPLQYTPMLETRRDGALPFRAQLLALGDVNAREGETLPSRAVIERILANVEIETLDAAHKSLEGIRAALASVHAVTTDRVGFENAVGFPTLGPLVDRMADFLRSALVKRDPSLAEAPVVEEEADAPAEAAVETGTPPGALDTMEGVDAALGAALGYFARREPSSPALLLISQARETLGKNLYDVMRLLAPTHADNARVFVGPDGSFTVPVSSLSTAPPLEFSRAEVEPAASRTAALALIDAVATHMRKVEPSSPAPYLLERARMLASRDFLSLLQEVLPEDDLGSMKQGR